MVWMDEDWIAICEKERKEHKDSDLKRFAEHDDKICFEVSEEFKKGYDAAKAFYRDMSLTRGDCIVVDRVCARKKAKELIEARQKIKDLVAEAEFYSKAMHEVEAHWLTRCVRFCQTFGNRVRYKLRDIYYGARHLVRAVLPRKKGCERECRSTLHQTLQAHLKETKDE
jgi:hypothetical protein